MRVLDTIPQEITKVITSMKFECAVTINQQYLKMNLTLKSLMENYLKTRMTKKTFYSSPRPSTTYLQAPKSTPDYFQAERSFSGNRQVILKTEYFLLLEFDCTFSSVFYCYVISSVTFKPKHLHILSDGLNKLAY